MNEDMGLKGPPPRRLSFQAVAFAAAALSVLILAGAFVFLGLDASSQDSKQVIDERLMLANIAAARIDYVLGRALTGVQTAVQAGPVPLSGGPAAADLYGRIEQQLSSLLPLQVVMLLSPEGKVLWTAPAVSSPAQVDFTNQEYAARALASLRPAISNSVSGVLPGRPLIFLAVPARGPTGEVIGLVQAGIAINESDLAQRMSFLAVGSTGYGELVDHSGIVLASTSPAELFSTTQHAQQFASLIDSGNATAGSCHPCHRAAASKDILAFAPLVAAPWGVAVQQSEAEAFAPVQQFRRNMSLIAAAALLAALAAAWAASRYISKPVRAMASASRRIAQGDFSSKVQSGGPRELYALAQDFEGMRTSLKASREQAAKWQDELKRAVAERTRDLASLVRASEVLASSLDPDLVLRSVVEGAVRGYEAEVGALFLWSAREELLRARAAVGYEADVIARVRLRPGEGIVGKVFSTGQAILTNDASRAEEEQSGLSEENRAYLLSARGGREASACLCVPLVFRERTLGTLFLAHLREGAGFTPLQVDLASTFARIASALLENLRLLQEASEAETQRQAERLKSDFLSNVTHDLKTPLATLKASLDFLSPTFAGETGGAQASLLENARHSADRLEKLVNDLVDVARLQNLQLKLNLEPLDLAELVRQEAAGFEPLLAGKGQSLELHIPEAAVMVRGDERRLQQVLGNLIMNAHQYTGPWGRITLLLRTDGRQAMVSVRDNGRGISAGEKDHIFERFYRGSSDQSGLGLGLTIARGLVELHGGKIWMESEAGAGTTFTFSLPLEDVHEDTDR